MIQNFPYYITLVALFLPIIAANLDIDLHRVLLLFTSSIFVSWLLLGDKIIKVKRSMLFFYLIFVLLVIGDQIFGRGLRNFSYGHALIYVFIYFHIFMYNSDKISANLLFQYIDKLFKIIMFFMFVESIVIISGNGEFLMKLFPSTGRTSVVEGFKSYQNRFADYYKLGYQNLNSLISGTQVAANLLLTSMVWFAPIYKYRPKGNKYIFWFISSTLLFLFSPNMTSAIVFILVMIILMFILPVSNLRKIQYMIPIILGLFLVASWAVKFIFLPFYSMKVFAPWHPLYGLVVPQIDWYWYGSVVHPINEYFSLPLMTILFGSQSYDYGFRVADEVGLIRLASTIGLPLIIMVSIATLITLSKSISLTKLTNEQKNKLNTHLLEYQSYVFLAQVNILIVITWLLTTIHYLVIFRLGTVTLIAFHFSVSYYSIFCAKKLIKSHLTTEYLPFIPTEQKVL